MFKNLLLLSGDPGMELPFLPLIEQDNVEVFSGDLYNHVVNKDTLIVFEGGTDVSPSFYDQPIGKFTQRPHKARDDLEEDIFSCASMSGAPMVGICRGAQFLTVMNGGDLVQHVRNHGSSHLIETFWGEKLNVTSTHHQMMSPWNLDKEDYKILGWAFPRRSPVYLNGNNKEIEPPTHEPEIVFYPKTRCLCIQGHPEYVEQDDEFSVLTRKLIKQFLLN